MGPGKKMFLASAHYPPPFFGRLNNRPFRISLEDLQELDWRKKRIRLFGDLDAFVALLRTAKMSQQ